jgi:hypothetical protein
MAADPASREEGRNRFGGTIKESETFDLPAAVPEPSTWAMLLIGLAGVGFMAYRRGGRTSTSRLPEEPAICQRRPRN